MRTLGAEDFGVTGPAYDTRGGVGAGMNVEEFMERDLGRYQEAGLGELFQGATENVTDEVAQRNIRRGMRQAGSVVDIALGRRRGPAVEVAQMSERLQESVRNALAGRIGGKNLNRINELQSFLAERGGEEATRLSEQLAGAASAEEKAAVYQKISAQVGRSAEDEQRYFREPTQQGIYDTTRFRTPQEMYEDAGRFLGGRNLRELARLNRLGKITGGEMGAALTGGTEESRERLTAAAQYLMTDEGRAQLLGAMDPRRAREMRGDLRRDLEKARVAAGEGDETAAGRAEALQRTLMVSRFTEMRQQAGGNLALEDLTETQLVQMGEEAGLFEGAPAGMSRRAKAERARGAVGRMIRFGMGQQEQARVEGVERLGARAGVQLGRLREAGVMEWGWSKEGGSTVELKESFADYLETTMGEEGSTAAKNYMKQMLKSERTLDLAREQLGPGEAETRERERLIGEHKDARGEMNKIRMGMSVSQMRHLATGLMSADPERARGLGYQAELREALGGRGGRGRGPARRRFESLAGQLQIPGMTREQIKETLAEGGGGVEALTQMFTRGLGLTGEQAQEQMQSIMGGLQRGGVSGVAQAAESLETLQQLPEYQKKVVEKRQEDEKKKREEDWTSMGKAIAGAMRGGGPLPVIIKEEGGESPP
jgi:hypothetical protein